MKAKTNGAVAVVALAMIGSLVFAFFRPVAAEAVYPVEKAGRGVSRGVSTFFTGLWHGVRAQAENGRLKSRVRALEMECAELRRLEGVNERLAAALNYTKTTPGRWLAAGVLSVGGGAAGAGRTVRVDRGSSSGVKAGAVVAAPAGLVGRVVAVTPHTSDVRLIADAALKVSCTVEGAPGVMGVLSGGSTDLLVLKHLNATARVAPGARVLTSGRGGVFPGGIPVGTLLSCEASAGGPAKEGEVRPAVDFSTLEDVFIRHEE